MDPNNWMRFSTRDQDNDSGSSIECAVLAHGAWWYNKCTYSNLNGEYAGSAKSSWKYPTWYKWKSYTALKGTEMMIRPKK